MIIENKVQNTIVEGGSSNHTSMSINKEAEAHVIRMLTRAYSDKIGSIVREATANGVDSMRMAGKDDAVIVRLRSEGAQWYFEVEDKGLGLNKEEFNKYIMGIGESTKRGLPNVIGGFGIGCKAAISYTSQFFYTCRKDGWERKFIIYEGEKQPDSDMLYEMETDKWNGVLVSVPVAFGDHSSFLGKIKEQLAYFDSVYFDIQGFDNSFKIFRDKDFQWSELGRDRFVHISMDNVYYPIDWGKLSMSPIEIPIALRFSLVDGLMPIPNREQLEYTKETIKLIKDKIGKVADYFVGRFNSEAKVYETFLEAYSNIGVSDKYVTVDTTRFKINTLLSFSSVTPIELSVKGIVLKQPEYYKSKNHELLYEYDVIGYDDYSSWKTKGVQWRLVSDVFANKKKIVLFNGILTGNVKEYLRDKHGSGALYVRKERTLKLNSKHSFNRTYRGVLGLTNDKKEQWRDLIKEFQFVRDSVVSVFKDETDVENTQEYKEWLVQKREWQREQRKLGISVGGKPILGKVKGEITIRTARKKMYHDEAVFDAKVRKIEHLKIHKGSKDIYLGKNKLFVCLNEKEAANKDWVYQMMLAFPRVDFITLNPTEAKYVDGIHNYVTLKQFYMSKPFARMVTAKLIDMELKLVPLNESLIYTAFPKYKDLKEKLVKYKEQYYTGTLVNETVMKAMLEAAKEHNIYDFEIYSDYLEFQRIMKQFGFVSVLDTGRYGINDAQKKILNNIIYVVMKAQKIESTMIADFELVPKVPVEVMEAMYTGTDAVPPEDEEDDSDDDDDDESESMFEDEELEEEVA